MGIPHTTHRNSTDQRQTAPFDYCDRSALNKRLYHQGFYVGSPGSPPTRRALTAFRHVSLHTTQEESDLHEQATSEAGGPVPERRGCKCPESSLQEAISRAMRWVSSAISVIGF